MKIPVAIKILNEATGPKANVEFMDVSILKIWKANAVLFFLFVCCPTGESRQMLIYSVFYSQVSLLS